MYWAYILQTLQASTKELTESAQTSTSNGIKIAGDLINRVCMKFGGELAVALCFFSELLWKILPEHKLME